MYNVKVTFDDGHSYERPFCSFKTDAKADSYAFAKSKINSDGVSSVFISTPVAAWSKDCDDEGLYEF